MKAQLSIAPILIFLTIGLIILIAIFGVSNWLMKSVNTEIQADDTFNNDTQVLFQEVTSRNNIVFDNAFIFLFGGLMIALFFAGLTASKSPIAFVIVFILLFGVVWLGIVISNMYQDIADDFSGDIDFATDFPKAHFIMSNLVIALVAAVLFFGIGMVSSNQVG